MTSLPTIFRVNNEVSRHYHKAPSAGWPNGVVRPTFVWFCVVQTLARKKPRWTPSGASAAISQVSQIADAVKPIDGGEPGARA